MEIKIIAVKDLQVDKYNARHGTWVEDEELIDSISKQGIIEPLVVRKSKDGYSIICGSRRWNAARKTGLKEVPCIIKDMNDMDTLAFSLQENLQRGNLDSVQTSEAIADLWEMMNGGKSHDEKMGIIKERFGMARRTVEQYLNISRLSSTIKKLIASHALDINTADSIATSSWGEKGKEQAAEIVSRIDSGERRKAILSKMKKYEEELTPQQAYNKVKKIERINWYRWRPSTLQMNQAMDTACKNWETDYNGVIDKCVTSEFKRNRWL